ncbi:uncharacterized protein [Rhodnius prolixus]|uniref:uncharacterized protein n=1 Tax=Rhodnius prolixus TaxID=13249 RepID=UPI003D18F661
MLPLIFIILLFFGTSNCKVDFCDENQLPLANPLQFTKELTKWEYAVDSKFKSLHCCARGYLSIEWFKDGRPYPWTGDVSSFIVYPESANQTVYTQSLSTGDAGNYTCRIHNDTLQVEHNTELKVFDSSGYMENPLATYSPPEISMAAVGDMARLYCEAFVGYIDLPDATSEVIWTKEGNDTLNSPRVSVKKVQRENDQIIGGYLMIEDVNWSDFGTYVCTISNTGDQKIIMKTQLRAWNEWSRPLCLGRKITLILSGFIVTFVIIIVYIVVRYYMKSKSTLSPFWHKIVGLRRVFACTKKSKATSLVLIFGDGDQEFVDNKFLPLLNKQSHLKILPQKTKQGEITEDLRQLCLKTEKVVILMSHQLTEKWTRENISLVLDDIIASNYSSSYCVVLLEQLPEDSLNDYSAYLNRPHDKFILSAWDKEMISNGHPFWESNSASRAAQPKLRVVSSSVVITSAAPFRYLFMSRSQPNEVPV